MLFNSLHFLVFFPVAVTAYFATPGRHRWAVLLLLSYYFYASWNVGYLVLLAGSTLVDYLAALGMGRATDPRTRKAYLALSLSTNLGALFFFKYFNFLSETIHTLLSPFGLSSAPASFHVLLPVGISFYTFQTMAYALEVYRGRQAPVRHLGRFALYVSFFPQLVAGPIERPGRLLPQLERVHPFVGSRVVSGLTRMAWGFFLKLVIADRLAVVVNAVYDHPEGQSAGRIVVATWLFAFQIYADFAGYTDIAIGAARVMGFDLMENFRRPYFATSITDFWKRWHISMTSWFQDYVFVPLGGARKGRARALTNVAIVFALSGLWHGAAWTYVASGLLFAGFFIFGHVTRSLRNAAWARVARAAALTGEGRGRAFAALRPWVARLVIFNLICVVWIFFRSPTIGDAVGFVRTIAGGAGGWLTFEPLPLTAYQLVLAAAAIAVLLAVDVASRQVDVDALLLRQPRIVRWGAFYGIATAVALFGRLRGAEFIYFQF